MRWRGRKQSSNVEDHRGRSGGSGGFGGYSGGGGSPRGGMNVGCGTLIFIGIAFLLFSGGGGGILDMLGGMLGGSAGTTQTQQAPQTQQQPQQRTIPMPGNNNSNQQQTQRQGQSQSQDDEMKDFIETILYDMETTWSREFASAGQNFAQPKVVMFSNSIRSACGFNSAASGPFYCPGDQKIYIDTSFFKELARLGGAGDFAMAYVLAHEVGHHIQKITGIEPKVRDMQRRASTKDKNYLSVLMELQADCIAGVWGNKADRRGMLEEGDVEEGLNAAASIGDDRLQKMSRGYTHPESWTHGSSEQRVQWLKHGLRTGDIQQCDTFSQAGY